MVILARQPSEGVENVAVCAGGGAGADGRGDGPRRRGRDLYIFSTELYGPPSPCALTGSFAVDSAHFNASGNTDISSFITDLSFAWNPLFTNDNLIFDVASGFHPEGVTVTPAGDLTKGPGKNLLTGADASNAAQLQIGTDGLFGVVSLFWNFAPFSGIDLWQRSPIPIGEPVPEPATWALFGVGALMLAVYGQRRRNRSAKIAYAS
jgi:hypothetical protein